MPNILFIAAHRKDRSPSQRFRFEQYLPFFESQGYTCELANLLSEKDDKNFYRKGNYLQKTWIVFKAFFTRWLDITKAKQFDIVFVQREAFMLGTSFFERKLKKLKTKLVFDFDDAIWNLDVSEGNKNLAFLKNPQKTAKIIQMADCVIAGNTYLAAYALQYNLNTHIIPTAIDTQRFSPQHKPNSDTVCIGWSGSKTTIKHFEYALPFLSKIKEKYGDKIQFKVIGDENYQQETLSIQGVAWEKSTEVAELASFDIGIMPLPDDEWSKGKCGFKGISYMALAIPTLMSPVGVNAEIIQDGENGFLASNEEEWVEKLSLLIESKELREHIGNAGRKTVKERFSVEANKEKYLQIFQDLLK